MRPSVHTAQPRPEREQVAVAVGEHAPVVEAPGGVDLSLAGPVLVGSRAVTGVASKSSTVRRSNSGPLNSFAVSTSSLSITTRRASGLVTSSVSSANSASSFVGLGLQLDDVQLGQPPKLKCQDVIGLLGVDR